MVARSDLVHDHRRTRREAARKRELLRTGQADSLDGAWPDGWASIRLLGVSPQARGLGIGRALMQECLRRARADGAVTMGLHTTKLMDVARAMYLRLGFARAPAYDFHPAPDFTVEAFRLDL